MEAERYKKIDEIFDAAIELEPSKRAAFLHQVCGTDSQLRREVESLLEACQEVGNFMQTPAIEAAAKSLAQQQAFSFIGHSIKQYKILSLAGAGGMGEVYIAEDQQLGRKVALKILPAQFTRDPDRIARFQRESRAASALNHPNIITIHEIGQDRSTHFIVTEYIEGDTLRKKMAHGKLALKEAIEIALQIASALEAAHTAGIIHRDIKPENLMIRRDGYVKVLDFGLAKLSEKRKSDPRAQNDHHLSTQTGAVMGTINYMSPEQAMGQEVDHRTDIFSLGAVFYEMATGKNPFKREHFAATLQAILEQQPDPLTSSNPAVSVELERLVTRMLEKDRDFRYQTAVDLRASLRRLQRGMDSGITVSANKISTTQPPAAKNYVSRWWRSVAIGLGVLAICLLAAWLLFPRGGAKNNSPNWQNAQVEKITDQMGREYFPSLSPDGKSIIYASDVRGDFDIYVQRIGTKKTINLTEDSPEPDTQPTFSPDGTQIAFRSERDGGGIFLMNETGESVRQLTNYGYNPAWSPDGKEVAFAENEVVHAQRTKIPSQLWAVNVATGESRLISEGDAVQPSWSPNGKRIAYWTSDSGKKGIWTMRPDGSDASPLIKDKFVNICPVWSPDGNYLYFITTRNAVPCLWRVAIEESSGKRLGEPEMIPTPNSNIQHLSFSREGKRMAFIQITTNQNAYQLSFRPDENRIIGQPEAITRSTSPVLCPAISPNGEQLVYIGRRKRGRLIVLKTKNAIPNQLTHDDAHELFPRWSPDGKRIAFQSGLSGFDQIYIINSDGSGRQQITDAPAPGATYPIWSPTGTRLAYSIFSGKTFIMDLSKPFDQQTPEETPFFPNSQAYFIAWDWSPDGKYLVGNQGENGIDTKGIYIYSLATKTYEEIIDLKIADLSSRPLWLNDSRHLLFGINEKVFVADTQTKKVQEIFTANQGDINIYSLTKDNRYIYASIATPESDIWMLSLE